jgi:hypothetical protein
LNLDNIWDYSLQKVSDWIYKLVIENKEFILWDRLDFKLVNIDEEDQKLYFKIK